MTFLHDNSNELSGREAKHYISRETGKKIMVLIQIVQVGHCISTENNDINTGTTLRWDTVFQDQQVKRYIN